MFRAWKKVLSRKKTTPRRINKTYRLYKEAARALILARLQYFNQYYQLTYNRVAIRDQRRCWGSCSSKGNLNFSYKLLFLPPCLRDYVVVHELCHLRVLNHSQAFWDVMAEIMPDYKERALALRTLERTAGTAALTLQKLAHQGSICSFCIQASSTHSFYQLPDLVGTSMKENHDRYVVT